MTTEYDWNIWIAAEAGACQYLGTCRADNFANACRKKAAEDNTFRAVFDADELTFRGLRLYPSPKPAMADASGARRLALEPRAVLAA